MSYKPVDPYKTKLNSHTAFHMALCSECVYMDSEANMLAFLQEYDSDYLSVKLIDIDGSQAAYIEHDKYIVYSFRGTDEAKDWLTNVNAFPDEWNGGKYHRGFSRGFDKVWEALDDAYWEKRRAQRRPVFLAGHSLGGALATCCAGLFNYRDWPFMGLYTFGSPRCVEKHTSRVFNMESKEKTFRFQNSSDIVTRMPARAMGYSHTGHNMFIDGSGVIQTDSGFWIRFVDFVSVAVEDLLNVELSSIKNHDMKEYREHIDRWFFKE